MIMSRSVSSRILNCSHIIAKLYVLSCVVLLFLIFMFILISFVPEGAFVGMLTSIGELVLFPVVGLIFLITLIAMAECVIYIIHSQLKYKTRWILVCIFTNGIGVLIFYVYRFKIYPDSIRKLSALV